MTCKELAREYQEQADKSSHNNGLWKGAYGQVAHICRTYHKARARAMFVLIARRYRQMTVSFVYACAARQLGSRAKF